MPWKSPGAWAEYLAAAAGSALYGLYTLHALLKSDRAITRKDIAGVALNFLCALACGLLLTFIAADRLSAMIPWATLRGADLVAFALGAFGWELLPLAFPKALRWAERKADAIAGRDGDQ